MIIAFVLGALLIGFLLFFCIRFFLSREIKVAHSVKLDIRIYVIAAILSLGMVTLFYLAYTGKDWAGCLMMVVMVGAPILGGILVSKNANEKS